MKNPKNEIFYDYVCHYNPWLDRWALVHREDFGNYMGNTNEAKNPWRGYKSKSRDVVYDYLFKNQDKKIPLNYD
jgi:hypothetical protein